MKSLLSRSLLLILTFLIPVLLLELSAADATEKTAQTLPPAFRKISDEQLVIAKGVFSLNGESVPATVRNLIDLVAKRYPDATITVVGVENVVIDNLALTLRKPKIFDNQESIRQPLISVLMAFSEASGRKFVVRGFSDNDFLLVAEGPSQSRQITEVFNLGVIMKQGRSKAAIEDDIRRAEIERSVLKNRYEEKHPRMVEIVDRIEIFKKIAAQTTPASPDVAKLIEQIQSAVDSANELKGGRLSPEFRYHPGTNLLIVVGSEEAVDVIRKVIAALEKSP